ncbi:type II secretion system F family protein [Candidatus Poriferisodalis sp.]|uniref:type II secretion system F family protein n=1 Tax=Candidatus Poriferisodalis sp. TaxID=3101277 RepID=UPI003B018738
MIVQALMLAAAAGGGILLIVSGLRRRTTQTASAPGSGLALSTRKAAGRVERDLRAKQLLSQDAAMMGRPLEVHALVKLGGLVGGGIVMILIAVMASLALSISVPPMLTVAFAAGGALLGWWLPDSILKTEANKERERFKESAEAWLELVAQLVTAGSDATAALHTASGYSSQPAFAAIRNALTEASALGEPPWIGLRRLSETRRLRFMEPFIASLELAGTTGAGSRQAIVSQVEAARSKSLAAADAAAASASEKMGGPLALIGGGFMLLMAYPPLAGILNSDSLPTGL